MIPFPKSKILATALCLSLASVFSLQAQEEKKADKPAKAEESAERAKPRAEKPAPKEAERRAPVDRKESSRDNKGETRPWIGVAMSPVASSLRDHLELAEGFGIAVEKVMDGSPAEKAGLRSHDILTKLDEQLLTTPEHLQLLVRSMKVGDKVDFTFIRKGSEQTVAVTLAKSDVPLQSWSNPHGRGGNVPHGFVHPRMPKNENWSEMARAQQDRLQKMMEENRRRGGSELPGNARDGERKGSGPVRPPAVSVRPGFPVEVVGGNGMIRIDNQKGEVTIVIEDGGHQMTIKDDDGKQIFKGPYKAGEKDGGLPEKARDYLKEMKLDDLDVLLPKPAEKKTENAVGKPKEHAEKSEGGIL